MLKLRLITAVVLLAIILPLLFYSDPRPFVAVTLCMLGAGAWEWARLNQLGGYFSIVLSLLFSLFLIVTWLFFDFQIPGYFWWIFAGIWLLAVPTQLMSRIEKWQKVPLFLRLTAGLFSLMLAWVAMAQARLTGTNFLLSIFALVWVADVAAYFGGRKFGRYKLAPSISPGKTWEGVISGLVGVLLISALWILMDTYQNPESKSFYYLLFSKYPIGCWFIFLCLVGVSVAGDLFESLVKRSVGVKDSSNLLPGHGGILDRIDALIPVLPLATLFLML